MRVKGKFSDSFFTKEIREGLHFLSERMVEYISRKLFFCLVVIPEENPLFEYYAVVLRILVQMHLNKLVN